MRGFMRRTENITAPPLPLIGREAEINIFRRVLDGTLSYRIIALSGFGGVGKSTLLEYLVEVAEEYHTPVGLVNARHLTGSVGRPYYGPVVEALTALERSLHKYGSRANSLTDKLQRYRQLHRQLTDKFGEHGSTVASILHIGFTAIRAGSSLLPFGPAIDTLFNQDLVNRVSKAIAEYRKDSDRALLLQPVEELTACFVDDLRATAAAARRPVVLFFDEFELLHPEIDVWLRRLFTDSLGSTDRVALLVIAGRTPLSQDWIARGRAGGPLDVKNMNLTEFTRDEAVRYLCRFVEGLDVVDAERISDRLGKPCRLPLVLRLLVAKQANVADLAKPGTRFELGTLTNVLIDRLFDRPESPESARDVALMVSVARSFDLPLLEAVLSVAEITDARVYFDWLEQQHFINPRAPAYTFYDLAREIFIARLRATNAVLLRQIQLRLVAYFNDAASGDDRGEQLSVEATYHRLSATRSGLLPIALNALLTKLPNALAFAIDWSRMLSQVANERADLSRFDADSLQRLSQLVRSSWQLASPANLSDRQPTFDPARNIFFTSFYEGERLIVDESDAEKWLSYLECRLRITIGGEVELDHAESDLVAILADTHLEPGKNAAGLLTFCTYIDLAEIHARRGSLTDAVNWSSKALELARGETNPFRMAVALYHLSTNQKRQGSYRDALSNLNEAITLIRTDSRHITRYYLGRLLLDKANIHTYLNETQLAEDTFEAARSQFRDLSPQSYAEVSHRIGWLKRVQGRLDDSLADHLTAVKRFRELEAELLSQNSVESSNIILLRAKALHSMGNVLSDMCRHDEALACHDEAIEIFHQQDARRHIAIALKDRAWSKTCTEGALAAENDLLRAIAILGDNADTRQRAASSSPTHLAEAWLQLGQVRAISGRTALADAALRSADQIIGTAPDNQTLRTKVVLLRCLLRALDRNSEPVDESLCEIEDYAEGAQPPLWGLSAQAALIRSIAATSSGRAHDAAHWLAEASYRASRGNRYAPAAVREMLALLRGSDDIEIRSTETMIQESPAVDTTATLAGGGSPSQPIYHSSEAPNVVASSDELIDIYDAEQHLLGQATSKLAHLAGLWHRTFHCWIGGRSPDNVKVVMLQQRGPYKRDYPNYLDISAAGHYLTGEQIEGGLREIREELGLTVDPSDLRLIACRTIDERLPNGVINREFQQIFLLDWTIKLEDFTPRYPEVAAIYYCDLSALQQLLAGDVTQVPCTGITTTPEERRIVRTEKMATLADFIPTACQYLSTVLPLLDEYLDRVGSDSRHENRVQSSDSVCLPDGSLWNPV